MLNLHGMKMEKGSAGAETKKSGSVRYSDSDLPLHNVRNGKREDPLINLSNEIKNALRRHHEKNGKRKNELQGELF